MSQRVEVIAIEIQQRGVHRKLDLEHVENWIVIITFNLKPFT